MDQFKSQKLFRKRLTSRRDLLNEQLAEQRERFTAQKARLRQQIQLLKDQQRVDRAFRKLTYFAGGIAMPLLTLPQLYTIWSTHLTAGVSLATWVCYTVISLIFFIFGLQNRQKLLMVTYFPMFVIELGIVVGLLVY